ncbi:MAG TPA: 23S rRNA (pseudouridine(1915)-N(3))-methyltransferase RlmH [Bacteroidetes bacterium]|nr:23S rRNA (pseudouridine(1915)-N(3))-methyltransferase RlmH [Bacteroidota bacterium]
MKITLLAVGKTREAYLKEGQNEYLKRLFRYVPFEYRELPDVKGKNLKEEQIREKEAERIIRSIPAGDRIILFDERGEQYSSEGLARWLQRQMMEGSRNICLVIGGPYGFSSRVRKAADQELSLSRLTFSHQMVRLIILEQLYRAFTILKGEPYHHS